MTHLDLKLNRWKLIGITAALMMVAMLSPRYSVAQAPPAAAATIHGHVQNAAGFPVVKGDVKLTTDRAADAKARKYPYTFPIDASGNFTGGGIAPGDYVAVVFVGDVTVDFIDSVKLAPSDNKLVDFDMTRKEYTDKMTPDEKKALDEFKKQNAAAAAANAKVANLNASLLQARADTKAGNFAPAITAMKSATDTKPDEAILWIALADAQLGQADADAKAAKASGKTPSSDPAIMANYSAAAASYQKGIDLNAASKKPSPDTAGTAYNQLGQAYAKMGDAQKSSEAYEGAAKAQPTQAGMYYYNEAATLYNAGKMEESAAAADKAIEADSQRADAYYIKAQALIPKATVDPKTQKIVAPPGTVEAYQNYLALAPTGAHAEEIKAILQGIGEQVKSSYKAPPVTAPKKK